MAVLNFYTGTMDAGKSTLALQLDYNHRTRGLLGVLFTSRDRAGEARLTSRLGLERPAVEVDPDFGFWDYLIDELSRGGRIDYLVCDEAQFYSSAQIDQLARIADDLDISVYAFGILTDFRTRLFPGSARLVELADRVQPLQVEALCWCGERATHNARTEDGLMVTEGEVIVVGDTEGASRPSPSVGYEVLCRRHHRRRITAANSGAAPISPETLPFDS